MGRKNKVSYFYDPEVSQYYYGQGHPMKPHRLRMAHSLILHYGLHKQMQMFKPTLARAEDMAAFHSEDYLQFLQNVGPGNQDLYRSEVELYALGEDCPIWDGMYHFSQISAGGSIGAAVQLNYGQADVAINWAGGLHHAKKSEASGFCYVNDIVLAILELLKYHQRVLYIDIDVHHGDGVEEAFLTTDRVLTVSLHKFGDRFFPGTGNLLNVGNGRGKYYSINVPLRDGITDDTYQGLFKPLMTQVMERYQPGAVVLQCGADSLAGDKLGVFSLSLRGHAACISFMRSFGVPLLLLGGGGYRMSNVARCWAYETSVALGHDLEGDLPPHEFLDYYSPDFRLHVPPPPGLENINSKESLDRMLATLLQHVSHIQPVAPAGFHERAPDAPRTHAAQGQGDEDEEDENDEDMVGGGT